MAAGNNEIIIDTKLDVKGIRTGTEDVEKSFRDLAKEAAKIQREIQQSYAKLDIDASVSNIKDSLAEIKAETDRMSESISDPIEEAFEEGEEASKTASRKMRDDLDDVGDQARKTGDDIEDGIVKNLAKLAGTAAAAISVDAIIEFGKQAIELGSDLQEVQNVVDVTFTTMSDKVNAFAKTASQTAGMSETMAKQYIGTFGAMANSFGFAEEEIFDMSVSLTQLAGDLASFYNLAQDEAAGKLKGIFTGETEALKELGVVMTQTALDAYAMEKGFDKTTDSMTEQEKVALRYQFVMENLSAASGDFVRTSESWANQTRTLALQFEGLMASLGTGLINIFSPAIEFLNAKVMPALNNAAEGFAALTEATGSHKLAGSISALQSTMDGIDQTFQQTAGDIEKNAIMAEIYSTRLKELEESGLTTAEAQREYANIIRELNALYPELNLQIDEQTGYLDENSRAQLENIDAMKQRALYQATEDRYTEALNAQANAILAVQDAEAEYLRVQTDREFIERQLADTTDKTVDELYELYSIEKAIALAQRGGYDTSNIEGYADSTEKLTQKQKNLLSELMAVAIEEAALQRNLDSANLELAEADALTEEYHAALSGVVEQSGLFTQNQEQATEATDELAEAQQELVDAYKANYEASMEAITSQIGLFDELSMKSEMSA